MTRMCLRDEDPMFACAMNSIVLSAFVFLCAQSQSQVSLKDDCAAPQQDVPASLTLSLPSPDSLKPIILSEAPTARAIATI